jgi:hypothetical protein
MMRCPLGLFLALMLALGSSLFVGGCADDDKKPIMGPAQNFGVIPLVLGNYWRYEATVVNYDCSKHGYIDCLEQECRFRCEENRDRAAADCERQYQECLRSGDPLSLCQQLRAACLADADRQLENCYRDNCSSFRVDVEKRLCALGGCFLADGGVLDCGGQMNTYPGCDLVANTRFFSDTVSSYITINGVSAYAINGDHYRLNLHGGTYYLGSRGNVYKHPVLEFKYPATVGETYLVNYEERGAYAATVVSMNEVVDDIPAAFEHRHGPFICYHYKMVRQTPNLCGCPEVWDYWIAPGIGIVKARADFAVNRDGTPLRSYEYHLRRYRLEEVTYD